MQELVKVTGMILKAEPIGEMDRRIVILTLERGKITAFVRGARKPNSRFVASTNPFIFGNFMLYEGKSSYSLNEVEVKNYFEDLRLDYETAYMGMYFLEIASYYTRENNDERGMLALVYQSLRALMHDSLDNKLVRAIYEIKSVVINGEFMMPDNNQGYKEATLYAIDYIVKSSIEKLYTFKVTDEVLKELAYIGNNTRHRAMGDSFKSLEVLDSIV